MYRYISIAILLKAFYHFIHLRIITFSVSLQGFGLRVMSLILGKRAGIGRSLQKKNSNLRLPKQVYIDGVNKEQAFYYHMWVLEYFLFAQQVAARSNDEFSVDFKKRIPKMANFFKGYLSIGGGASTSGAMADDGFVSRFDPCWPEKPYLEMIDTTDAVLGFCEPVRSQKAFWYRAISEQSFKESDGKWQRDYPVAI